MKSAAYRIRSLERHDDGKAALFSAINGFATFIFTSETAKAKSFFCEADAREYALKELFTHEAGVFDIVLL